MHRHKIMDQNVHATLDWDPTDYPHAKTHTTSRTEIIFTTKAYLLALAMHKKLIRRQLSEYISYQPTLNYILQQITNNETFTKTQYQNNPITQHVHEQYRHLKRAFEAQPYNQFTVTHTSEQISETTRLYKDEQKTNFTNYLQKRHTILQKINEIDNNNPTTPQILNEALQAWISKTLTTDTYIDEILDFDTIYTFTNPSLPQHLSPQQFEKMLLKNLINMYQKQLDVLTRNLAHNTNQIQNNIQSINRNHTLQELALENKWIAYKNNYQSSATQFWQISNTCYDSIAYAYAHHYNDLTIIALLLFSELGSQANAPINTIIHFLTSCYNPLTCTHHYLQTNNAPFTATTRITINPLEQCIYCKRYYVSHTTNYSNIKYDPIRSNPPSISIAKCIPSKYPIQHIWFYIFEFCSVKSLINISFSFRALMSLFITTIISPSFHHLYFHRTCTTLRKPQIIKSQKLMEIYKHNLMTVELLKPMEINYKPFKCDSHKCIHARRFDAVRSIIRYSSHDMIIGWDVNHSLHFNKWLDTYHDLVKIESVNSTTNMDAGTKIENKYKMMAGQKLLKSSLGRNRTRVNTRTKQMRQMGRRKN